MGEIGSFGYKDKWNLANSFYNAKIFGDGEPREFLECMKILSRLYDQDSPINYTVSKKTVDEFRGKIEDLKKSNQLPANHEIGLRFYLGKDDEGKFVIVIVPMYGPERKEGQPRNRKTEKEKEFFKKSGVGFFALVPSLNKVIMDAADCDNILTQIDKKGKGVVYFTEKAFSLFIDSLEEPDYETMILSFGRTEGDEFLTLFLMFLSDKKLPIRSRFGTLEPLGVCFDQGDLIPPPPLLGLSDSSLAIKYIINETRST